MLAARISLLPVLIRSNIVVVIQYLSGNARSVSFRRIANIASASEMGEVNCQKIPNVSLHRADVILILVAMIRRWRQVTA